MDESFPMQHLRQYTRNNYTSKLGKQLRAFLIKTPIAKQYKSPHGHKVSENHLIKATKLILIEYIQLFD